MHKHPQRPTRQKLPKPKKCLKSTIPYPLCPFKYIKTIHSPIFVLWSNILSFDNTHPIRILNHLSITIFLATNNFSHIKKKKTFFLNGSKLRWALRTQ